MSSLLDKLEIIHSRWLEIEEEIAQPDVMTDMKRFVKLNKDYKDLQAVVDVYKEYKNVLSNIKNAKEVLQNEKDDEFRAMAKEELFSLNERCEQLETEIKLLLIPSDPQDSKNAIVEIRAGTGGDEASIFAGDLFRMYSHYCENKNWKIDVVSVTEGTVGGFKEIVFNVMGEKVYGLLKYESGVHRVQRVPQTEAQGRVHTSAASVVVLPEADEFDVDLKEKDIRKDTYCSSGPGGQSVNTTYSAIRLTHIPTGIVVAIQDEKSQIKNKQKALKVLKARLYEVKVQEQNDKISSERKSQIGTGDRSERIRTYNFPQGRLTDHRINLTLYKLDMIMNGDIEDIIDALRTHYQALAMSHEE